MQPTSFPFADGLLWGVDEVVAVMPQVDIMAPLGRERAAPDTAVKPTVGIKDASMAAWAHHPPAAPIADDAGLPAATRAFPPPTLPVEPPRHLTPEQRHYLVRALVSLQLAREMDDLMRPGQLVMYGAPFASAPVYPPECNIPDGQRHPGPEPIIFRFIYHSSIKVFPFLSSVPERFWRVRIQALADDLATRQMSSSHERGMVTLLRFRLLMATDLGSHFFSRGVSIADNVPDSRLDDTTGQTPWRARIKRGLSQPARLSPLFRELIDNLFPPELGVEGDAWKRAGEFARQQAWDWRSFWVQCIEEPGGMRKAWAALATSRIADLPPDKRNVTRVVRNGLANLLRQLLLLEPESDLMFRSLQNGVAAFPFWPVRQVLRSPSAAGIVQGLISILLVRPAGTQCVIQRIVRGNFGRELKLFKATRVAPVAQSIPKEYAPFAARIQAYVQNATPARREAVSAEARHNGDDILTVVLLRDMESGMPTHEDEKRVRRMQASFAKSKYSGHLDAASPVASDKIKAEAAQIYQKARTVSGRPITPLTQHQGEEALAFARLKLLLRETFYARDLQNAKDAMKSGLVPGLLKDLLDALFPVFALASKRAHLSDRLLDIQIFLEDLIATRKLNDPSPETWSALVARHEQNLWTLLHELSCIPEIADPLLEWCERGCAFMATSELHPISTADENTNGQANGHANVHANGHANGHTSEASHASSNKVEVDCDALLASLDTKTQAAVRTELDVLVNWNIWDHARSELIARRGLLLAHPDTSPPPGLGREKIPDGMAAKVGNVDELMARLMAQSQGAEGSTAIGPDTGVCLSPARGTETKTDPDHWFDSLDPCGQHLLSEGDGRCLPQYVPTHVAASPPALLYTRMLLPAFVKAIQKGMQRYY